MRSFLFACLMAASACKKNDGAHTRPLPNEEPSEDMCCCQYTQIGDEKPTYEVRNRMECSTNQGACVGEPMCQTMDTGAPATP